jgi:GT2 family glycosyltransferase
VVQDAEMRKLYQKAKALLQSGDLSSAFKILSDILEVLELNRKDNKLFRAMIYNEIAEIQKTQGDVESAKDYYKKAIYAYPLYKPPFWNLINIVGKNYEDRHLKLSIVFTTYNRRRYLERCIRDIRKNTFFEYEIIVVCDPSNDGTEEFLKEESKKGDLIPIINPKHLGIAECLNTGFSLAQGDYIAVGNDDAFVLPGWDLFAIDVIDGNEEMGCAAPLVISPNGCISQPGCYDVFKSNSYPWIGQVPFLDVEGYRKGTLEEFPELQYPMPCNYALFPIFKRTCFEAIKVNGCIIDPRFIHYYQDNDIGFRIQEKGLKVIYCPLSTIIHLFLKPKNNIKGSFKFLVDEFTFFKKWDITISNIQAIDITYNSIANFICEIEKVTPDYESIINSVIRELNAA